MDREETNVAVEPRLEEAEQCAVLVGVALVWSVCGEDPFDFQIFFLLAQQSDDYARILVDALGGQEVRDVAVACCSW